MTLFRTNQHMLRSLSKLAARCLETDPFRSLRCSLATATRPSMVAAEAADKAHHSSDGRFTNPWIQQNKMARACPDGKSALSCCKGADSDGTVGQGTQRNHSLAVEQKGPQLRLASRQPSPDPTRLDSCFPSGSSRLGCAEQPPRYDSPMRWHLAPMRWHLGPKDSSLLSC